MNFNIRIHSCNRYIVYRSQHYMQSRWKRKIIAARQDEMNIHSIKESCF